MTPDWVMSSVSQEAITSMSRLVSTQLMLSDQLAKGAKSGYSTEELKPWPKLKCTSGFFALYTKALCPSTMETRRERCSDIVQQGVQSQIGSFGDLHECRACLREVEASLNSSQPAQFAQLRRDLKREHTFSRWVGGSPTTAPIAPTLKKQSSISMFPDAGTPSSRARDPSD